MIESINIAKAATYGEAQAMDRLGLLNFVFGTIRVTNPRAERELFATHSKS